MTAKEKQRMARLEMENELLREQITKHMRVYGTTLCEIIDLKAKLQLITDAVNGDDR